MLKVSRTIFLIFFALLSLASTSFAQPADEEALTLTQEMELIKASAKEVGVYNSVPKANGKNARIAIENQKIENIERKYFEDEVSTKRSSEEREEIIEDEDLLESSGPRGDGRPPRRAY